MFAMNSAIKNRSVTDSYEDAFWILDMLSALAGEAPKEITPADEVDDSTFALVTP